MTPSSCSQRQFVDAYGCVAYVRVRRGGTAILRTYQHGRKIEREYPSYLAARAAMNRISDGWVERGE